MKRSVNVGGGRNLGRREVRTRSKSSKKKFSRKSERIPMQMNNVICGRVVRTPTTKIMGRKGKKREGLARVLEKYVDGKRQTVGGSESPRRPFKFDCQLSRSSTFNLHVIASYACTLHPMCLPFNLKSTPYTSLTCI